MDAQADESLPGIHAKLYVLLNITINNKNPILRCNSDGSQNFNMVIYQIEIIS